MFREFNVKFEDVEMLGGADNLLEGTEITKVIVRGDNNKMSSLDSMLKNCKELDTVEGELDLNGVSDIDNLLEGTELVKSINLKNINNENISANNSFPHVDQINIGGELYNKKAMQNVIASKEWTFDNINYQGTVSDNIVEKEVNIVDDNKTTIQDTLEQKAKGIEIIGQTYENLIEGRGEYKLTDTFSTTWTESNDSIENPPSMIEIPEIWGNTVQGYANVVTSKQVVDSIVNSGVDVNTKLNADGTFTVDIHAVTSPTDSTNFIQLKANTTYSLRCYRLNTTQTVKVATYHGDNPTKTVMVSEGGSFTTDSSGKVLFFPYSVQGGTLYLRCVEGQVNLSQYDYDEMDLNYIQSVGDLYVDESGEPILDEEGNEQYKLEIESSNKNLFSNIKSNPYEETAIDTGGWGGIFYSSFDKCTYKLWKNVVNGNSTPTISILSPTDKGYIENKSILQKGKTYTLSGIFKWSEKTQRSLEIGFFDAGMNLFAKQFDLYGRGIGSVEGKFESRTFTLDKDAYGMYIKLPYGGSYAFDLEISNFMIEENTVATDYVSPQSNKTTILMPQPLRKVDSVSDKLYWDNDKKKYIVEKNIDVITPNISEYGNIIRDEFTNNERFTFNVPSSIKYDKAHTTTNDKSLIVSNFVVCSYADYDEIEYRNGICKASNQFKVFFEKGRFITVEKFKTWFENSDTTFYYSNTSPQIIETKILEKPSLETYSPKTYITTNTEIQPSQMTVTNKRNLIDLKKMKANTDYTLQLKCNEKGNKPIKINLCGKEKDIDATIGVNHVNITTNELNDNKLELSGEGNIVSEIIVVEGEMNQYPKYFEGVQSVGVLENGKYRIDIKTNEGFNISINSNSPLAKGDKLYWSKSNKRYEIDRSGSIEVPTVSGDIIDLPRLYQGEDTNLIVETGNIKPAKTKIVYKDII